VTGGRSFVKGKKKKTRRTPSEKKNITLQKKEKIHNQGKSQKTVAECLKKKGTPAKKNCGFPLFKKGVSAQKRRGKKGASPVATKRGAKCGQSKKENVKRKVGEGLRETARSGDGGKQNKGCKKNVSERRV